MKQSIKFTFKKYGTEFCNKFNIPVKSLQAGVNTTSQSIELEASFLFLWIKNKLVNLLDSIDIDVDYTVRKTGILRTEKIHYYSANTKYLIGQFCYFMQLNGEVRLLYYQLTKDFKEYLTQNDLAVVVVVDCDKLQQARDIWNNSIYNLNYHCARYHRLTRSTMPDKRVRNYKNDCTEY